VDERPFIFGQLGLATFPKMIATLASFHMRLMNMTDLSAILVSEDDGEMASDLSPEKGR